MGQCCSNCLIRFRKKDDHLLQDHPEEILIAEETQEPFTHDRTISVRSSNSRLDYFKTLKVLGKGGFGKVVLVQDQRTRKYFAMKIISKQLIEERNQRLHIKAQKNILEKMNFPFIVNLHCAFQNRLRIYLVMDFMRGGELFFHLRKDKRFSEQRARMYGAQILLALEYLHSKNIIYRDLKPENVLIDESGYLKITDFGLSKFVKTDQESYTFCGTPEYLAPEILMDKGYGKPADWWSFGALLYQMVSGFPPFYSKDQTKMYKNKISKPVQMKEHFSANLKSLLKGLLQIKPDRRLGKQGSHEIKEHPFFSELEFGRLLRKQYKMQFKPQLQGQQDLRYFDRMFTSMDISQTPERNPEMREIMYSSIDYKEYRQNQVQLV